MTLSAIPAPRENWTRYPNAILDNLDQFSGSELKVVSCVVRQNVGFYGNPNYRFSVAYVAENTGLSELTASRALRGLTERGTIILLSELGPVGERQYAVNWEIESDESAPIKSEAGLNKLTDSPLKSKGRPPKKVTGIKETNTKKQSKETNTGFSKNEIRELTDHLLEIRPELREKESDWWAQQVRHVQSVRKIFPTLTVSEYKRLLTAHFLGKRNGAFWDTPTDLRAVTIKMRTHLEDWADRNPATMDASFGISEYRTEFSDMPISARSDVRTDFATGSDNG